MKKIFIILISTFIISSFLFIATSFASDEEAGAVRSGWRKLLGTFKETKETEIPTVPITKPKTEPGPVTEEDDFVVKEMTDEDIYESIKTILEAEEEILDYVPQLKATFNEDGAIVKIEYSIDGVFRDIKELDKNTLMRINSRVGSERIRIINQRREDQLERTRRPKTVPTIPRAVTVPTVPRVPTVPQIPTRNPASVPTVPSVPTRR